MALETDYFLLYHGVHFPGAEDHSVLTHVPLNEENLRIFSLLLTLSRKDFDRFLALDAFHALCESLQLPIPKELNHLYALQYSIIQTLTKNNSAVYFQTMHETFLYLMQEEILSNENYKKLISLFTYRENETDLLENLEADLSFMKKKEDLIVCMALLDDLIEEKDVLKEVKTFLDEHHFSVGITGVMNAGKSTMINALMGKEILGTSVIPETANLTVLKYDTRVHANVFYWNKNEWGNIVKTSEKLEVMKEFVEETNKAFDNTLDRYIQSDSRVDEIAVEALAKYTSAEDSDKKCNLVKYVELKSDLLFLKDGVEIVDTPGLDDPVIQREEITKEYIARCDMLLHLMNVSQSATQKDVEFIIDALLYQNITKLLIVITRADTVSQKELDEVITYTRRSIEAELILQNKTSKLDYILETITFIAISGKMALLCKTEKEKAEKLGYSLEDTGFLKLESYLEENLFGSSSQKSNMIIQSAKNRLLKCIYEQKNALTYALELSLKSKEELEAEWVLFTEIKREAETNSDAFRTEIEESHSTLKTYMRSLEHFLNSEFYALQTIIRERVVSDVRYAYETTKKIPQNSRIKVIVQTAFKDGMIDIIRDYRYKLAKKFEETDEEIAAKSKRYGFTEAVNFNAETFFADLFKSGFLTHNIDLFIQQILDVVKRSKAKNISLLDREIKEIVQKTFVPIEDDTEEKLSKLSTMLIEQLVAEMKTPLASRQSKIKRDETSLNHRMETFDKEDEVQNIALDQHEQMKQLTLIEKRIKGSDHA